MLFILSEAFIPLLSLSLFILGTGFLSTLLILIMANHQESTFTIGALSAIYYGGFIFGALRMDKLIIRIGHIRAYATFSSLLTVIYLLHGLIYNPFLWMIWRFMTGIITAGLYIVIESWLLCKSTRTNRGQMMALYMIAYNSMFAFAQFFLNAVDLNTLTPFVLAAIFCSFSAIPLAMTSIQMPQFEQPSTLSFRQLARQSMSGFWGCFSSGLMMGSIFGLLPVFLNAQFHQPNLVATYMFATLFGGMLLQYPLGKLSDLIERRLVLLFISMGIMIEAIILINTTPYLLWLNFILMLLFGGLTFAIYPISTAQACDALKPSDLIGGVQSLLVVYSIGATLGPLITPLFITIIGKNGTLLYFALIGLLMTLLLAVRKYQKADIAQEEEFLPLSPSMPILVEMDPRVDSQ